MTDHTTDPRRERIAAPADWIDGHPQLEAIAAAVWERCGRSDSGMCVEDDPRNIAVAALNALLAVLPPADRAAVLREAADALGRMDYDTDSNDYGYDTYRDAWNGGVMDGATLLRRMADEAQPECSASESGSCLRESQSETACDTDAGECAHGGRPADEAQPATEIEAHPAEHSWAAELYDPLADEWVPGTRYAVRDRAVNHLTHARSIGPAWKDGTPVQRRLVRATTTYTVEPS
ncbi:hypothetical protein SGLAM104S_01600 [Streptomyces glaucescens]